MVYVVAFEEDGYARDVTPRYAVEYGAKVSKMQQGGKGKQDWWERVMTIVRRPYRLVSMQVDHPSSVGITTQFALSQKIGRAHV